jgi:hypothetical protein
MTSRQSRMYRRRCFTCDNGGELHPCNGCGKVFHADRSCCGRRETRTGLAENGPLLCGDCYKEKCPCCSQSFKTVDVIGCYEHSGGCGQIFHLECVEEGEDFDPSENLDWKCPHCRGEEEEEEEEHGAAEFKQDQEEDDEDDEEEVYGIPSDESDDWDDSCSHCGRKGILLLCDGCPAGFLYTAPPPFSHHSQLQYANTSL